MAFDVFVHRGNAFYATFTEIQATVTNQAGALQEVRDNHRLKYVQLELPVGRLSRLSRRYPLLERRASSMTRIA